MLKKEDQNTSEHNLVCTQQKAIALYWDFENVHAGVMKQKNGGESNKPLKIHHTHQEAVVDVSAIFNFVKTLGSVIINLAFAHWGKFDSYRIPLLESSVDLVQIFPAGAYGKNGADIRLCLDIMEDISHFPHIQTIVVVSGDSDYLSLAHKIKASGRQLYGIGNKLSTNPYWAKSCHHFTYYEDLVKPETATTQPLIDTSPQNIKNKEDTALLNSLSMPKSTKIQSPIKNLEILIVQAILRLTRKEDLNLHAWISRSSLRSMMKTLDTDLDKTCYGFDNFKAFIAANSALFETSTKRPTEVRLKSSYFIK